MRVVVAPGSFGSILSAVEAASAIAEGWARQAPADVLTQAPLSDGGAGFVDVLYAGLAGDLVTVGVPDAAGGSRSASLLVSGDTGYVESAQAFALGPPGNAAPAEQATSRGVGVLVRAALESGVSRVVVGVGEGVGDPAVAPNDGGAGLLAALGAISAPPAALSGGVRGLGQLVALDLTPVAATCAGVELVLATDDDTPLLGLLGTTSSAGAARGVEPDRLQAVDAQLERLAALAGHRRLALARGAGAGGGLGYGLLLAGATRAPGLATTAEEIGFAGLLAGADLVVTGDAALDSSASSESLSAAVAARAGAAARPCIALTLRGAIGARESRALGLESVYGVPDGSRGRGAGDAAAGLAALAERVARTWSWSRSAP